MKILFLAGSILIFSADVRGQVISPEIYQTEEDLLEGLQNGELTFDQYLELVDLMRRKMEISSPDSQLLLEIPDLDLAGLDSGNSDSQQRIYQFIEDTVAARKGVVGRVILQLKQRISESSDPESYLRLQAGNGDSWSFYLEGENDDSENRIKRRGLEFGQRGKWKVLLGNFQPEFGLGVNVGYRSYLNFSSDSSLEAENSLLFPLWTRYNGLSAKFSKHNHSLCGFYSQNRFGNFRDQVVGGQLELRWRKFEFAPVVSYQEISKSGEKFISWAGSTFGKWLGKEAEVSAELAVTREKEKGLVGQGGWRVGKGHRFQLSFWSYTQDFIHPISGGKALPDYRPVDLEGIDLTFRSRQAGESGIYFSSYNRINRRTKFELAYQQWRDGNTHLNKNKARLGVGYWVKKNLEVRVRQYWEDDDLSAEFPEKKTTALVGTYLFSQRTKLQVRLNYRMAEFEDGHKKSTWEEVIFDFPIKEKLRSKLRVRYYHSELSQGSNSSWHFYLSEILELTEKILLRSEFVSKEYQDRKDYQVMRIRVEWEL